LIDKLTLIAYNNKNIIIDTWADKPKKEYNFREDHGEYVINLALAKLIILLECNKKSMIFYFTRILLMRSF